MKIKRYPNYEKGLTLIEVLAALVLLGIVFIGFMSVFPQMTLFNKKTEIKLQTMNLARQEMAYIQSIPFNSPLNLSEIQSKYKTGTEDIDKKIIQVTFVENDYNYVVDFDLVSTLASDGHPKGIALNKVHVKVLFGEKVNSETFGYIEVKKP